MQPNPNMVFWLLVFFFTLLYPPLSNSTSSCLYNKYFLCIFTAPSVSVTSRWGGGEVGGVILVFFFTMIYILLYKTVTVTVQFKQNGDQV